MESPLLTLLNVLTLIPEESMLPEPEVVDGLIWSVYAEVPMAKAKVNSRTFVNLYTTIRSPRIATP